MSISPKQLAMARILLDLSQKELAVKLDIARKTIMRIENGQSPGSTKTLQTIRTFFENNGLEFFPGDGVKRQTGEIQTLKDADGLKAFMQMVYDHAKNTNGNIYLHNAKPNEWYKWLGKEWYERVHVTRMQALNKRHLFKITCEEGTTLFISDTFAEYRWFPREFFSDQPIYAFGDLLAFVSFEEDNLSIRILKNAEFSKAFQGLFNIAWNRVAIKPPKQGEKK